ncbi:MAG: ATP-binding protein [Thermodesulfobacteriota bacterium]
MEKETPLYNSRITNTYLEYLAEHHPGVNVGQILKSARIERYEIEDAAHWLTQSQVNRFHDALVAATDNPGIARAAGRFTTYTKKVGAIKKVTLGLISPFTVYLKMGKLYSAFSRGASISSKKLAANKIQVTATPNPGVKEQPFQCENRIGTFESLALLFTKEYAKVDHPECFHKGDTSCRYTITWTQTVSMRWKKITSYAALATLLLFILTHFVLPGGAWEILFLLSGVLAAGSFTISLLKEKQELVQTVENQGNVAREMLDAANSRYNATALMNEVGSATATIMDAEHLIKTVLELMKKRLSFDRGLIMIEKDQKRKLQYVASYGTSDAQLNILKRAKFDLDNPDAKGLFIKVYREQQPYLIDDIDKISTALSDRSKRFAKTIASKSFICVPLVYQKDSFGIMAVDNLHSGTPLTQSNLSILNSIGAQIAAGLANANVFKKMREGEERFRELYQESKKAEALYRSLIHSSADAILLFDMDFTPQYLSPAFVKTFQWTLEDMREQGAKVIPKSTRQKTIDIMKEVMESGKPLEGGFETKAYAKDGKMRYISISASRYDDHEKKPTGLLVITRDISEKKRLENQLQHAQKMEAIGTLAGGIAHDFNNLLSVVQGNLSLMKMEVATDHPVAKRLHNIRKQIKSGARLTSQLLGYARKGNYQVQTMNLAGHLKETAETFGRARKEITINFDPPVGPFIVEADPGQMEQVLFNLYVNAADAMPQGGELSLRIDFVDHNEIKGKHYTPIPGNYVMVEVSDTGIGMSPDIQKRVFEPFFTTKTMGKGTGLGLASVYGIIKTHNGYIEIESQPDKGTTITVFLPASDKNPDVQKKPKEELAKGKGNILYVDDETMLLEVGSELLEMVGYKVQSADSGKKAIEIFQRDKDAIDLVLFDMIMPGMNGGELFDKLKEIKPDIKAILSSGYSIDGQAQEIITRGCNGFIQKPFDMKSLSRKIRDILEGKKING